MKIVKLSQMEEPKFDPFMDDPMPTKIPEVFKRNPKKMNVDFATREVMEGLDRFDNARQISEEVNANPENDLPESTRGKLEMFAPTDPIAAEALRVLNTLTPELESAIIHANFPDTNALDAMTPEQHATWLQGRNAQMEALENMVNLKTPREKEQCVNDIVRAIGEKPEFADITQLTPEELAAMDAEETPEETITEPEASETIGAGVTQPTATPMATPFAGSKVVLTKESWFKIAREKNWI